MKTRRLPPSLRVILPTLAALLCTGAARAGELYFVVDILTDLPPRDARQAQDRLYLSPEVRLVEKGRASLLGFTSAGGYAVFSIEEEASSGLRDLLGSGAIANSSELKTGKPPLASGLRLMLGYRGQGGGGLRDALKAVDGLRLDRDVPSGQFLVAATEAVTPDLLAKLKALPGVSAIEPDFPAWIQQDPAAGDSSLDLPGEFDFEKNWNLEVLNVRGAWGRVTSSAKVVAVVDTGVDYKHPDLKNNMWKDETGHFGRNLVEGGSDPRDRDGHGTHCAGIIAAARDGAYTIGVNPHARIMAIRAIGTPKSSGPTYVSSLVEGVHYAIDNRADVINCSWGVNKYSEQLLLCMSRARDEQITVVAAAGNYRKDIDKRMYKFFPAAFNEVLDNLISVAAFDSRIKPQEDSNWGDRNVDIAAPGAGIRSCWLVQEVPEVDAAEEPLPLTETKARLATLLRTESGTSMAAPHVSGAVSLYLALRESGDQTNAKQAILDNAIESPNLRELAHDGRRLDLSFLASRSNRANSPKEVSRTFNTTAPKKVPIAMTAILAPPEGKESAVFDVNDDLVVDKGGILSIQAGVTLRFAQSKGIICAGAIRATGTDLKPVRFEAADPKAGWGHILLADGAGSFTHCVFVNGRGVPGESMPKDFSVPEREGLFDPDLRQGGAVLAYGNNIVSFHRCQFLANDADLGGAIRIHYLLGLSLVDCRFQGNKSRRAGGAVFSKETKHLNVVGCQFTDNHAQGWAEASGGAVYLREGLTHDFDNCQFESNVANYIGGAIYSFDLVREGEQRRPDSHRQLIGLNDCTFKANAASAGGGAMFVDEGGEVWIGAGTFVGNRVGADAVPRKSPLDDFGGSAIALFSKHPVNEPLLRVKRGTKMPPRSIARYKFAKYLEGPKEYEYDMDYKPE